MEVDWGQQEKMKFLTLSLKVQIAVSAAQNYTLAVVDIANAFQNTIGSVKSR